MSFPGIYVTGNVVVDTLVRPADRLPEWGSTTCVDAIAMRLGGNASGAACAAAMMGVPARIAGMVGADAQGAYARARLEECGVDTTRLAVHPRQPTAATVGLIHSGGERLFFHVSGACGVFSCRHLVRADGGRGLRIFPLRVRLLPAGHCASMPRRYSGGRARPV